MFVGRVLKPTVADVLTALESIAPTLLAEDWDRVGLMVGRTGAEVAGVLVALDPTEEAVEAAVGRGADCLVSHHPLLFKPLDLVDPSEPVGRIVALALARSVSILAAHTNLDKAPEGVSDVLAGLLGLTEVDVLLPQAETPFPAGLGRLGRLERGMRLADLAERVKAALGLGAVRVAGGLEAQVGRVAVCGGAGGDLVPFAAQAGAQVLIAGEIGHHAARQAEALGLALIEAGHFASEAPVVPHLAQRLEAGLKKAGWTVPVRAHATQGQPFVTV